MRKWIALGVALLVLCVVGSAMAQQDVEVKFLNETPYFLDFYVDDGFKCCIGPDAYFITYVPEGMHTFKACDRGTNNCTVETGYIDAKQGPYTWTITPR